MRHVWTDSRSLQRVCITSRVTWFTANCLIWQADAHDICSPWEICLPFTRVTLIVGQLWTSDKVRPQNTKFWDFKEILCNFILLLPMANFPYLRLTTWPILVHVPQTHMMSGLKVGFFEIARNLLKVLQESMLVNLEIKSNNFQPGLSRIISDQVMDRRCALQ